MASPASRIALVATAVIALGAAAYLGLRPDAVTSRHDSGAEDEMPARSDGASSDRREPTSGAPAPLAAGGRAPRPLETPPAATGDDGAVPAPSAPPALPGGGVVPATQPGPVPPARTADGVAGVVFDPKGPASGAVVRMRKGKWSDRKYGSNPPGESELTITVDAEGRFVRSGLEAGDWWAEVAVPGRMTRVVGFRVGEAGAGMSLPIGDGGVEGRLYDREGKPMSDAVVTIDRGPVEGSPLGLFLETKTSADGSFRFDGLVAGPWWLVGFTGPDRLQSGNRTERIVIVEGMTIAHDLGIPRAEPRWSGVVRTRSGKPVRGGGAAAVFLIEKEVSRAHGAKIDSEGRFSDRFPAGRHSVAVIYLGGTEHKPIEVGEIALDGDLEKDVTLPGSRLSGTIRAATGALPTNQRIYWTPEGKDYHAMEAVNVGADGTYVVDGLAAGRYRITGFPHHLFDARGDPPIVEMADDRPEVALDVVARPP